MRCQAPAFPLWLISGNGHAIDLDVERTRPLRNNREDTSWLVSNFEVALVYVVKRLEVVGRRAEDVTLEHVAEIGSRGFKCVFELRHDALSLFFEGRVFDFAGLRIKRRHAGDVDRVAGPSGNGDGGSPFFEVGRIGFDPDQFAIHNAPRVS